MNNQYTNPAPFKILLLDDDQQFINARAAALSKQRFQVDTVYDVTQARQRIDKEGEKIAVVMADIRLSSNESGLKLL